MESSTPARGSELSCPDQVALCGQRRQPELRAAKRFMRGCGNFAVGNSPRSPPRRLASARAARAGEENEILLFLQAITLVSSIKAPTFEETSARPDIHDFRGIFAYLRYDRASAPKPKFAHPVTQIRPRASGSKLRG
jgi:hypothetical protein